MGINVAWVNERMEAKREIYDREMLISRLATSRWPDLVGSVCLRFVEPWGDTVFNQSQIPTLLEELRSEVAQQFDQATRSQLESVADLVAMAVNQTHTYIKFIGD